MITILTLPEAAARLKITTRQLRRFLQRYPGNPPFFRHLGRTKLCSEADIARLWEALQCPSPSSHREKAGGRTGASAAPTSEPTWIEALAFANARSRGKFETAGNAKSNVVSLSARRRQRSRRSG